MARIKISRLSAKIPEKELNKYFVFARELPKKDTNGFPWVYELTAAPDVTTFKDALRGYDKAAENGNITWWIELDGRPIGVGRTRVKLDDRLIESGAGNVGLGLISSERGKGYGEIALKKLILELRKNGVEKILVGAYKDNLPSRKIIEKNGGVLNGATEEGDRVVVRYWI